MSSSGDGDKPAQTGLVDMGDISFYNNPYNPSFNLAELAPYQGSFSEIVLNVTWAQLQPTEGGALATSVIDSAIAQVNALNASNGTNIGIKLRVWGGYTSPEWAKNINGAPITVPGEAEVDPAVYTPQTIGRFWTADYVDAWTSLQNALAARYDSNPVIRGISQTAGAAATDEPFVPLRTNAVLQGGGTVNQVGQLQAGGYTDAAEMLTLRAAIADYAQWSTTPLDFTMNTFHLFDSGNELNDASFTLAVLQQARNSTRLVQPGNHALGNPLYAPAQSSTPSSPQTPLSILRSLPTASRPIPRASFGPYANWQATIANGVAAGRRRYRTLGLPGHPGTGRLHCLQPQPGADARRDPGRRQSSADGRRAGRRLGAGLHRTRLHLRVPPARSPFRAPVRCFSRAPPRRRAYGVTLRSMAGGTLGVRRCHR